MDDQRPVWHMRDLMRQLPPPLQLANVELSHSEARQRGQCVGGWGDRVVMHL